MELMREIARKWNARYGEGFFPEPQALIGPARRIIGLDGQAKMSKSLGNTIGIMEDADAIWERLRPAMTDPARVTRKDPGTPEICNLYTLHQHFSSPDTVKEVAHKCRTAGWGCLDCKRVLGKNIATEFGPIRERAMELKAAPHRVRDVLENGADRARTVARETMRELRERMGFLAPAGTPSTP